MPLFKVLKSFDDGTMNRNLFDKINLFGGNIYFYLFILFIQSNHKVQGKTRKIDHRQSERRERGFQQLG